MLIADLLKLNTPELTLDQTSVPLQIRYKKGLFLELAKRSDWKMGKTKLILYPSTLSYQGGLMYIKDVHFTLADIFTSHVNGAYNTRNQSGRFLLKTMHAEIDKTNLFTTKEDVKVIVDTKDEMNRIRIPNFDLTFTRSSSGWDLDVKEIRSISQRSPFMQEYNITSGSLHLSSSANDDTVKLYGQLIYPYKILVKNNRPLDILNVNGSYKDETLEFFLNNDIKAHLKDNRLKIAAANVGIDLFSIFAFIKDHPASDTNSSKSKFEVDIQADNSYLYINEQRRALADKLLLQSVDGHVNAQLLHGKNGGVFMEFYDHKFFLYGDNLNDKFMDGLAEFSDFKTAAVAILPVPATADQKGLDPEPELPSAGVRHCDRAGRAAMGA